MTVQTFIPNGAPAASENTVTSQRTPQPSMVQLKTVYRNARCQMNSMTVTVWQICWAIPRLCADHRS